MSRHHPKILIHGYHGFHNLGDEFVLAVMLGQLRKEIPEAELVVASADPEWTQRVHGVPALDVRRLEDVSSEVRNASLVISGGGGLFQDYWLKDNANVLVYPSDGVHAFAQIPLLAKLYGKPLAFVAQGVGPIDTEEGARLVRFVMSMTDRITLRDRGSLRVLKRLRCAEKVAEVAPDPAFAYPVPDREESRSRLVQIADLKQAPVVGVCVRPWLQAGDDWPKTVAQALDALIAERDVQVVFIPFHEIEHNSDIRQSEEIVAAMTCRDSCRVLGEQLPHEAMMALAGCDAVLAMRLHSAICSLAAGVPAVALNYDPKVLEAMRQAGQQERVLDLETLQADALTRQLAHALETAEARAPELAETARRLAAQVPLHVKGLADLLRLHRGAGARELAGRVIDRAAAGAGDDRPAQLQIDLAELAERIEDDERRLQWQTAEIERLTRLIHAQEAGLSPRVEENETPESEWRRAGQPPHCGRIGGEVLTDQLPGVEQRHAADPVKKAAATTVPDTATHDGDQGHFDAIAGDYYEVVDRVWYDNGYYHREELAYVLSALAEVGRAPMRILDAGCGPGRHSIALAAAGHQVVSLDFALQMLSVTRKNAEKQGLAGNMALVHSDVRSLPFASESFDAVVCMEVLEHLPGHLDDARTAIAEFRRVLKEGGALLLEAPLKPHHRLQMAHPYLPPSWKEVPPEILQKYEEKPLVTWLHFQREEMEARMERDGFGIVDRRYIRVIPAGLIEKLPTLEAVDRALERDAESRELSREIIWRAQKRSKARRDPRRPDRPAPDQAGERQLSLEQDLLEMARRLEEDDKARQAERGEARRLTAALEAREADLAAEQARAEQLQNELRRLQDRWREYRVDKETYIAALEGELRGVGRRVLGPLHLVLRLLLTLVRPGIGIARRLLRRAAPPRLRFLYRELRRPGLTPGRRGPVTVYYDEPNPFPRYPRSVSLKNAERKRQVACSLVVTVRNEAINARLWLDSLARQTRLPDEVIIVDGGSTDGTLAILQEYVRDAPFRGQVISAGPVNIACGRNEGIRRAAHDVIVHTDFGCELEPEWLERLLAPFEINPNTEVACGWYEPVATNPMGRALALELLPALREVDPRGFLPSARSLAFLKEAWESVGGYPEWLSLTGEDTYFAVRLEARGREWAFVPAARVKWHAPESLRGGLAKAYAWSKGDGEAGLHVNMYWRMLLATGKDLAVFAALLVPILLSPLFGWWLALAVVGVVVAGLCLYTLRAVLRRMPAVRAETDSPVRDLAAWALTYPLVRLSRAAGFVAGVAGRPRMTAPLLEQAKGVSFILSGVPITDSGGGQRAAQLALALLQQGQAVVFINKFPSYETVNLNIAIGHPLLFMYSLPTFDMKSFLRRYPQAASKPMTALIEFPLKDFSLLAQDIHAAGGKIIYDCIDDWTGSLGGAWYSPETERSLIEASDGLVATAAPLKERLEKLSGRSVTLVPNAVNTDLFRGGDRHPRPTDLPWGKFVICYIGALWGEWFDWELLRKIALAYPEAGVAVIGDYSGRLPDPPLNLYFLGLKPQRDLPAYLAHSHVAIIPWKVSELTQATNPLKVYEYLAMRKPVVAPNIRPLEGLPYVLLAGNHEEFIEAIDKARRLEIDGRILGPFIAGNSWSRRVSVLLKLARGAGSPPAPPREIADRES